MVEARRALPQHDEPVWMGERKGPEECGVHQAEHRAVGADAEREDDDCDNGETGRAPQRSRGVAEVAPDRHAALDGPRAARLVPGLKPCATYSTEVAQPFKGCVLMQRDFFRFESIEQPAGVEQRPLDHGVALKRREGVVEPLD